MASSRIRSYAVDLQKCHERKYDDDSGIRAISVNSISQAVNEELGAVDKEGLGVSTDDLELFACNTSFVPDVGQNTGVVEDAEVEEKRNLDKNAGVWKNRNALENKDVGQDRAVGENSEVEKNETVVENTVVRENAKVNESLEVGADREVQDSASGGADGASWKGHVKNGVVNDGLDEDDCEKCIDRADVQHQDIVANNNGDVEEEPTMPESLSVPSDRQSPSPSSQPQKQQCLKGCRRLEKWLVLVAAFFCRMLGEGYANAMGIFFVEFLAYYQSGRGLTGWVISLTGGIMYGVGIPVSFLVYKTSERFCAITGALLACAGLIASSFSTSIIFLLFSFGIVPGIGLCMIQISYVIAVGRHFRDGRGAATAICETGVTVGGVAFPLLLKFLIETYGWRGALLISGGLILNMAAMGILFGPPSPGNSGNSGQQNYTSQSETTEKFCDTGIIQIRPFVVYVCTSLLAAFGYYFPYGIIVDLGTSSGYSKENSTYLVIGLSVANTAGVAIMAGLLKIFWRHSTLLYTLNVALLGISMYVFVLVSTYETLIIAIVLYGLPSGGLYGSYAVVVVDMLGVKRYTTGLGFACSAYGIGMALSAPAAGWINDTTGNYQMCFYIGGSVGLGAALIFGSALIVEHFRKKRLTRGTTFELNCPS